jgi:L-threonate 2-dehydrogenase
MFVARLEGPSQPEDACETAKAVAMQSAIAVIGNGQMGSAVAKRLLDRGAKVRTALHNRSRASRERVRNLGIPFVESDSALVRDVDIVLSIVPSGQALIAAEQVATALRELDRKPLFVDCNAVSPQTAEKIAGTIQAAGCDFVDGGIIGSAPRDGYDGTILFVSGPQAARALGLREAGLDVRIAGRAIGDASALKLSYAGITKGIIAVGTSMLLAAGRHGIGAKLVDTLRETEPHIWEVIQRRIPRMFPKADRWADEMHEIASYAGRLHSAGSEVYESIALLFGDVAGRGALSATDELEELKRLLAEPGAT